MNRKSVLLVGVLLLLCAAPAATQPTSPQQSSTETQHRVTFYAKVTVTPVPQPAQHGGVHQFQHMNFRDPLPRHVTHTIDRTGRQALTNYYHLAQLDLPMQPKLMAYVGHVDYPSPSSIHAGITLRFPW
ncbi:MAG: hypothetical protein V1916_02050 [Patescibacteria group bacterium]